MTESEDPVAALMCSGVVREERGVRASVSEAAAASVGRPLWTVDLLAAPLRGRLRAPAILPDVQAPRLQRARLHQHRRVGRLSHHRHVLALLPPGMGHALGYVW